MTGMEAHNLYPLLYQKAAHDLLEQLATGRLPHLRALGLRGPTPSASPAPGASCRWCGPATRAPTSTSPTAARGAHRARSTPGMSGIPLWGSDISGYHYVYNPPPDKEVYLRWTELGALSRRHARRERGAGNSAVERALADLERPGVARRRTRSTPGSRRRCSPTCSSRSPRRARAARPVMRHLFLDYPQDPRTLDDRRRVHVRRLAPGRAGRDPRGARRAACTCPTPRTSTSGPARACPGGGDVTAQAPLDVVPVFARVGAIVPMLAPDVETVVPPTDGRRHLARRRVRTFLDVEVFAGGQTSVTLDDGTVLHNPRRSSVVHAGRADRTRAGRSRWSTSAADADDVRRVRLRRSREPHAGPSRCRTQARHHHRRAARRCRVSGSPIVKRFVFRVRH